VSWFPERFRAFSLERICGGCAGARSEERGERSEVRVDSERRSSRRSIDDELDEVAGGSDSV
jgi:hypothetical protein